MDIYNPSTSVLLYKNLMSIFYMSKSFPDELDTDHGDLKSI